MEKWKECKLKDIIEFNPKESINDTAYAFL